MKVKIFLSFMILTVFTVPIFAKRAKTIQNQPTNVITSNLLQALKEDNISELKKFIKDNPSFQWDEKYLNLPWSAESQTPLSAATWLGSINSVRYLLNKNIGNVKMSINIPSSHNDVTALQYAQIPPAGPERNLELYPHQIDSNYERIAKILEKYQSK
jgi:hypothetical protein